MRHQQGFSYVMVMFLVALLSIVSVRALENSMMTERRQKEAQLLQVGKAYRDAIGAYYNNSPGTAKQFPRTVDELLFDNRLTRVQRPLRKLYYDPMTGSATWGYIYQNERLIGVYSLSTLKPLKRDGFSEEQRSFKNAASYQNWRFIYAPN
ncbi:type II secretion system protein [Duganella sp. CY15W]|uniref:type II secretion system protein n=1 Tax=Duganella sp. CY15W TaxID=2692172 RepID=UPI0013685C73|nr:type II secretion system protein [Duganella sp. CY15W]MYM27954.1 type II secretion system protein [Duganella sp. CY15W]